MGPPRSTPLLTMGRDKWRPEQNTRRTRVLTRLGNPPECKYTDTPIHRSVYAVYANADNVSISCLGNSHPFPRTTDTLTRSHQGLSLAHSLLTLAMALQLQLHPNVAPLFGQAQVTARGKG